MRIDHVAIYCSDFDAMKVFLSKYFGTIAGEDHLSKRSGQTNCFLSFPDGGSRLELMTYPQEARLNKNPADRILAHLSISVGSKKQVAALTHQLERDGYKVLSGPRTTGDGYYESCVSVIEDLQIEITE